MAKPKDPGASSDIVVFEIISDSACSECGLELGAGRLLRMEGERPLCMTCADLAYLVYLPRGDAALTRRASKYSPLRAVVVRFSRSRGHYERQGILVQEAALLRAERECLADAESRERARERRVTRAVAIDAEYRNEFATHVLARYPNCPRDEALAIAEHACLKYSGRIGRSAAAKAFDPEAIDLAVKAHVRHLHTRYDSLLARGLDRQDARFEINPDIDTVLGRWRKKT
jgi:hypothetical protein